MKAAVFLYATLIVILLLVAWLVVTVNPEQSFGYVMLVLAAGLLACILAVREGKDF